MKKILFILGFTCAAFISFSQTDTAVINDTKRFQNGLIAEYANPKESPLSAKAKKTFIQINFARIILPFNQNIPIHITFH